MKKMFTSKLVPQDIYYFHVMAFALVYHNLYKIHPYLWADKETEGMRVSPFLHEHLIVE